MMSMPRSVPLLLVACTLALASSAGAQNRFRRGPRLPEGVQRIADIAYAKDGERAHRLDLYLPGKSQPALLVWIHGGGWTRGSKRRMPGFVLRLLADGYAVASVEYRLTGLASHPDQIHDCKGAIRWLRAHAGEHGYDAKRIGVAGGSAGGHLVLLLGTSAGEAELEGKVGGNLEQSSRVQAVVDLYGPSDFDLFARARGRARGRMKRLQESHPKLFASVSPAHHVTKDDAPLLILHGNRDSLVPLGQSERMRDLYAKAGLEVALHVVEGAGHGGRQFSDAKRYALIKAFFDRHLLGIEEASAKKARGGQASQPSGKSGR